MTAVDEDRTYNMMLESERLLYRKLTRDDLPWLIEMRSIESVYRYLGGAELQSPEAVTTRMGFYLECHEKLGFGMCIMSLKETGEPIGTSGLQPLSDSGEIEVGYTLFEEYWRQGFGYEAAIRWLEFGFREKDLERIVAVAHPDNTGSWRIMEKCGMKYEKNDLHYGMECVFYAISREDFLSLHG
ncbi:MAG: GNAT family N-acetyltransferase [Pyrinomonadaceae bacterium]